MNPVIFIALAAFVVVGQYLFMIGWIAFIFGTDVSTTNDRILSKQSYLDSDQ